MATVTLHIGTMKTGTTFLQSWLWENREKLRDSGWQYPEFLQRKNHSKLAAPFLYPDEAALPIRFGSNAPERRLAALQRLAVEFTNHVKPDEKWIMSSERLTQMLVTPPQVEHFAEFLSRFFDSTRAVVYFRRQEFMAVSTYSQAIRGGVSSGWNDQFLQTCVPLFDHDHTFSMWENVLGAGNVIARPFLETFKGRDELLLRDFRKAAGLPGRSDWYPARDTSKNISISADGIALLLKLDQGTAPNDRDAATLVATYAKETDNAKSARKLLISDLIAIAPGPPPQFDSEMLTRLQDGYAPSNANLVKRLGETPEWEEWLAQPSPPIRDDLAPALTDAEREAMIQALRERRRGASGKE